MSNNNSKTNMKVNYFDEESEVAIRINNYEGVIHHYLIWKGEKWKQCEECRKKWFKVNGTSPQKYCKKCSEEIIKERDRKRKLNKL